MSTPADPVVAIVQHGPVYLNRAASLARAELLIEEAAALGAQLIVFPETWLPGYPVWLDTAPSAALWEHRPTDALFRVLCENAFRLHEAEDHLLRRAARAAAAYVVLGVHERVGGTLYNTTLYFPPDGSAPLLHRKLMPTYTERLIWGQGDGSTLTVLPTPWGNLGGLICWEHWMPAARMAFHAKQEAIHIAQWPEINEMKLLASRHYAFEGQCFVLAAGAILTRDDLLAGVDSLTPAEPLVRELLASIPCSPGRKGAGDKATYLQRGGSAIIGPSGFPIAGPVFEDVRILTATLPLAALAEGRLRLDTAGHYARPDVFHLSVDERPKTGIDFRK